MNIATHKNKWCVRDFTFAVVLRVALRPTGLLCQNKLRRNWGEWWDGRELKNHNQIQEASVCFIISSYTYCSWLCFYHLKQVVSASWIWRPCWCGWVWQLLSALPRTEMAWVFTRFFPRFSSKIVSILLTYCAKRRTTQAGTEAWRFQVSGTHETIPAKHEFFCSHYIATFCGYWSEIRTQQ